LAFITRKEKKKNLTSSSFYISAFIVAQHLLFAKQVNVHNETYTSVVMKAE